MRLLDELTDQSKRKYVPPYAIALIHAGLAKMTKRFKILHWMVPGGAMSFAATRFPRSAKEATDG